MKFCSRDRGSALVFALISSIILVAMVGALALVSAREADAVLDSRLLEEARLVTEGGLNLVVEDYQQDQAAPPSAWYTYPQNLGNGAFRIESDQLLAGITQRRLVEIAGTFEGASWGIEAIIGPVMKPVFDSALQANSDITMVNSTQADSYDSRVAPYDKLNPGKNGDVRGNSNFSLTNNSDILGDVEVTGTMNVSGNSDVSGDSWPDGDEVYLSSTDALVAAMAAALAASNDNGTIDPTMKVVSGPDVSIVVPMNKTKVLFSGDYYLKDLDSLQNSRLLFDTSGGPIRIVVHTDDVLLDRNSHFIVTGTNPVYVYLSGSNVFEMDNMTNVTNAWARADLFQLVINSNDPGRPRFDMGQNTDFYGLVNAPEADIILRNLSLVYGAIIGRTVGLGMNCAVHYDEALMDGEWILIPDSYRVHYKRRVI